MRTPGPERSTRTYTGGHLPNVTHGFTSTARDRYETSKPRQQGPRYYEKSNAIKEDGDGEHVSRFSHVRHDRRQSPLNCPPPEDKLSFLDGDESSRARSAGHSPCSMSRADYYELAGRQTSLRTL